MFKIKRFITLTTATVLTVAPASSVFNIDLIQPVQAQTLQPDVVQRARSNGWVEYRSAKYGVWLPPFFNQVSEEELRRWYHDFPGTHEQMEEEFIQQLTLTSLDGEIIVTVTQRPITVTVEMTMPQFVDSIASVYQEDGIPVLSKESSVNTFTNRPYGILLISNAPSTPTYTMIVYQRNGNKIVEAHYTASPQVMQNTWGTMLATSITAYER